MKEAGVGGAADTHLLLCLHLGDAWSIPCPALLQVCSTVSGRTARS